MNPIRYPFKNDHEIFIALIEDFNASIASLDKKMTEDHADTLEVKALLQKQYDSLSQRIEQVEKELLSIRPEEMALLRKQVDSNSLWIHDFNTKKHFAWIIASTGFLVIGYYLPSFLSDMLRIFGHGK